MPSKSKGSEGAAAPAGLELQLGRGAWRAAHEPEGGAGGESSSSGSPEGGSRSPTSALLGLILRALRSFPYLSPCTPKGNQGGRPTTLALLLGQSPATEIDLRSGVEMEI